VEGVSEEITILPANAAAALILNPRGLRGRSRA